MGNFYLDIETTGLNPRLDKIVTIQFQELDRNSAKPVGKLRILKEWESSEREILKQFIAETRVMDEYAFAFVPTGYNLNFEHNFLRERTAVHSFTPIDILNKPFIDLRAVGILMNRGEFKGSALDDLTGKPMNGSKIPEWYSLGEYGRIVEYVERETEEYLKFAQWLYQRMPQLRLEYSALIKKT